MEFDPVPSVAVAGGVRVAVVDAVPPSATVLADALVLACEEGTDAIVDIAGTAMCTASVSWHTPGGSGFGARLLAELACAFRAP